MSTSDDYEIRALGVLNSRGEGMYAVVRKETGKLLIDEMGTREWAEDALHMAGDQWSEAEIEARLRAMGERAGLRFNGDGTVTAPQPPKFVVRE